MRAAVRADQTGPIYGKANRQVLDRDVMDDLIIGALQKCRVDRRKRAHALCCKPGCKCDGMLFGNADVEGPAREGLLKLVEPGA